MSREKGKSPECLQEILHVDFTGFVDDIDFSKLAKPEDKELAPKKSLGSLRLLALDVDGVLTDGTMNIGPAGEVSKAFYSKDGLGISCALRSGLEIAIITGRRSLSAERRGKELGIKLILLGIKDKYQALEDLRKARQLKKEEVAFMGDDLNDLPAFRAAGFAFAPADAVTEVRAMADVVTEKAGGRGAVREAIEMILKARGEWEKIVEAYKTQGQGDKQ